VTAPGAVRIVELTRDDAVARRAELVALLQDAVDDGASIGFLPPLHLPRAREYLEGITPSIARGERVLLAALDGERLVGMVQLELAGKANARHRAEVQKLVVHTGWRGRGIGAELMRAVERAALARGRTLLVLDTREGDPASSLYARLGWIQAGRIPAYARNAAGALTATLFFYKFAGDRPPA
jgi:acetyltransferase